MEKKFKVLSLILAFSLIFTLFVPFQTINAADNTVKITLLGTSDIHSYIYPWEYKTAYNDKDTGLAKVYSVVKEVRAENPNTILIDNGDTLQGTEIADVFNKDTSVTHPMMAVMNYMKYDAWELGNHEFNYGLDVLNRIKGEANFPVLGANIYNEDGTNYVKPYVIKEVDGVKVGILGMVTPNIPRWDGDNVKGMTFNSLIDDGKKWVKVLKEDEKVDVVIASIHAGLDAEYWEDGGDSIAAVAEQVPGIDIILAGHAHSNIEGKVINGVLISEPARYGNRVARFDLTVEKVDGKWTIAEKTAENIDTYNYEAAPEIINLAKPYHEKVLEYVNTPIGRATGDFVPEDEIPGIPTAQIQDTALVDLINKVQMQNTGADVSLAALFISDSNLKKGPLSIKDAAFIYKYDNTLIMTKVTGKQLKDMMEWSANYFNTYKPGDITISFNPNVRGYNYDMYAGVDYDIDISEEPGNRIKNLTFNGKPVTDDMVLTLALNNYRYGGMVKDGYITEDKLYDSFEELADQGQIRNLIAQYIREKEVISPIVDNNWEIVGADLDHWARKYAIELIKKGIIDIPRSEDGRTPNVEAINLDTTITRGELVKIIVKALDLEIPDTTTTNYVDVDENLAPYVQAAVDANIAKGITEKFFGTEEILTREKAISLIIAGLQIPLDDKLEGNFKDKNEISDWAKPSIAKAINLGFINGTGGNRIDPQSEITYGQVVTLIDRMLKQKDKVTIKKIDIFSTNDFHGNLLGGYEAGLANVAGIFNYFKKDNPSGTLLLDAGDRFQGTPLSNVYFGKPVIEAFNEMGYDAATVGNHEFDWGIEQVLVSREEVGATYPLLAANIYDKSTNQPVEWAKPYTIVVKNGVKIGIVGLATPETLEAAKLEYIQNYDIKDPVEVANQVVPEVRKKGADVVVLLTHIPGSTNGNQIEGALVELANGVKDVDAIIGGHSHAEVAGVVNGIPVIEAYKNGRMLGHITIYFDKANNEVIQNEVKAIEVRKSNLSVEPDKKVQEIVDTYNEDVKAVFDEVIGQSTVELTRDYNGESNIGNWMTDVMREKANTQIAFQNAGGIRTDLPKGDITIGDIYTVMPFDNTIVTADMTGKQIKAVLEQSLTLYKGMMKISGLHVKYDSSQPEYNRIVEITLEDGTPLEMDKTYSVATNDFLSGGQDGFKTLGEVEWTNTYDIVRDALIEDIKEAKVISPVIDGRMFDVNNNVSYIEKAA